MTKHVCDFCGGAADKVEATLRIGAQKTSPWSIFSGETESAGLVMEMCPDCLGHLLPITARVMAERAREAAKPKPSTPGSQIVANEYLALLQKMAKP